MAQQLPFSPATLRVWNGLRAFTMLLLTSAGAANARAQSPDTQFVFTSTQVTASTSQVAGYAKNGQSGALSAVSGSPFPDSLLGGAIAVDALGRFLFVVNTATSNISMFQIDQSTGNLAEVPGSPFATGPVENPNMSAASPVCLTTEKSGQFLYVGYRFGNFANQGAINEYVIDAANRQLVPLPGQMTTDIASAPIGLVADPKGAHLYVGLGPNPSTGMADAGTNVYSIDPRAGVLAFTGTAGNAISAGRSIAIDPKGRFFFDGWGTTLGTIDGALISPADGTAVTGISSISSGNELPEVMLTDNSGKFLYVQEGPAAVVYVIDQVTGALAVPPAVVGALNLTPGSAAADPLGPFLYSLQRDGIHALVVDPQTGALSEVPGSPFGGAVPQGTLAISGAAAQAVSGPVASLFPDSTDFGSLTVGQTSTSKIVTLTNTGDQALSLASIGVAGADPADFIASPNCALPAVLAPNITCTISIVFSPSATGPRQASLVATDNAPGSPQSILLMGTGVSAQPGVALSPAALTFATTAQGTTSAAQNVTLTSTGTATLHISSVLVGGSNPNDFQVNTGCSGPYPVGATCNLSVTFSPLGAGQRSANVVITDDAPNSPQLVQLNGTGAPGTPGTAVVKLVPNNIGFGTVTEGTMVPAQTITLTNSGTGPLHITSVVLGGANSSDFTLTNNCTAVAYAPGSNCVMSIALAPNTVGFRSASVTITDDAPNSPQTIPLSATVNAAFAISAAEPGSTSVTVTAGQTANFSLLLTPGSGFTGKASFACTGSPADASCNASAVQFAGVAIPYVVSVATTANTMMWTPRTPRVAPPVWLYWIPLLAACGTFALYVFKSRRTGLGAVRPRWAAAGFAFAALLGLCQVVGCGGGSGANSQPVATVRAPGTPPGTSVITVTPSVTTSAGAPLSGVPSIQLTLIVQ